VDEAVELSEMFGVEKVYEHTGQPEISPTWPACKLLWTKKNHPGIFKKIHKVLLLEDFLIYNLTGKFAAEKSLLTSTIYFDINTGGWWKEILDFIGLSEGQLPEIYDSGMPVSNVSASAASEFGLSTETMVVTGALDQLSGMIGSGAVGSGEVCESTGTCLAVCVDVPVLPKFNPDYQIPCHAGINGSHLYQIYWSQTAGAVLEWFKNNFYKDSSGDIFALMNEEAAGVSAGSDGLTMLPHLSGKACPEFNPYARGVFYGMKLMHGRGHFTRAIMESVAYMLREHLETAGTNGFYIDEIRSLGGGANSPLWNQIKADVTGKRIITLESSESTCLGTAILAGLGTGVFDNVESAAASFAKTGRIYEPNPEKREIYSKGFVKYKEMYEKLKDSFSG
jgi:xylulokinase